MDGNLLGGLGLNTGVTYKSLSNKYQDFGYPQAEILLGEQVFGSKDGQMIINDITVELTADVEASVAKFRIYNTFHFETGKFKYDEIKKQLALGQTVTIKLGYLEQLQTVFVGFVAEVCFGYDPSTIPYIEVTGMDVKGIMMANSYARQLTAKNYGDAVEEIFQKTAYERLKGGMAITSIQVTPTPDKKAGDGKASAITMEMVSESDYDFVVKAAKKWNYEFFTECGKVIFRKAKKGAKTIMAIGVNQGMESFQIRYSIASLVQNIEVRAMDAGTGKLIVSKQKLSNTISTGNKAKSVIKGSKRVYVDASVCSQQEADARAASLMEEMSYRLGELDCECIGMPELLPGYFVKVEGFGKPVDNAFYIQTVFHQFHSEYGYKTRIRGNAAEVKA